MSEKSDTLNPVSSSKRVVCATIMIESVLLLSCSRFIKSKISGR